MSAASTAQKKQEKAQKAFNELVDSLTGYEELEIAAQFGDDIHTLLITQASMASRSLVYVTKRREGLDEAKAKDAAMSLTVKAVGDSFDPDEDEPFPEEPVTEQGKGDSGS